MLDCLVRRAGLVRFEIEGLLHGLIWGLVLLSASMDAIATAVVLRGRRVVLGGHRGCLMLWEASWLIDLQDAVCSMQNAVRCKLWCSRDTIKS